MLLLQHPKSAMLPQCRSVGALSSSILIMPLWAMYWRTVCVRPLKHDLLDLNHNLVRPCVSEDEVHTCFIVPKLVFKA